MKLADGDGAVDSYRCGGRKLNLMISVASHQGGRKYMEDEYSIVHYLFDGSARHVENGCLQKSFAFLGIFDGHGGGMASRYTRQNLCRNIVRQRSFWSDDDKKVCLAIHKGFVRTQKDMMNEVENWPKTSMGLPSTSGTTASVLFVMNGKYYTGHVGDSRIVLGRKMKHTDQWVALPMTRDHKPESPRERKRIEAHGGQVMNKSGVGRVVWNRPRKFVLVDGQPVTTYDMIPFLSVARSLGDLWSLNRRLNKFIVSPEPDVKCVPIDPSDRCLILASDGLWNMINQTQAVKVIQEFEEEKSDAHTLAPDDISHSKELLQTCLDRWSTTRFRADNTTVLVVMLEKCTKKDDQNNHLYLHDDEDSEDKMIGDTIHSYAAFDPKEIDETFAEPEAENEEQVLTLLNEILDRFCNRFDLCQEPYLIPPPLHCTNHNHNELIDDQKLYSIIDFDKYSCQVNFDNCSQVHFKCKLNVRCETFNFATSSRESSELISEQSRSSVVRKDLKIEPSPNYGPYEPFFSRDFKVSRGLYQPPALMPIYYHDTFEAYNNCNNDSGHSDRDSLLENKLLSYKKRKLFEYSTSEPEFLKRQCTVDGDEDRRSNKSSSVAGAASTAVDHDETGTKDSCIKEYLSTTKVHNFSIPHHIGQISDQVLASNQ